MPMPTNDLLHFCRAVLTSRPNTTTTFNNIILEDKGTVAFVYKNGKRIMCLPRQKSTLSMFDIIINDFNSNRYSEDIITINMILKLPLRIAPAEYLLDETIKNIPLRVELQYDSPALDVQSNGCERLYLPMSCKDGSVYYIDQSVQSMTPFIYDVGALRHMNDHNCMLAEPLPMDEEAKPERKNTVFDILRAM